jgi:hypothetical protein
MHGQVESVSGNGQNTDNPGQMPASSAMYPAKWSPLGLAIDIYATLTRESRCAGIESSRFFTYNPDSRREAAQML